MRVSEVFALLDERKNHQQHKLKRIKTSLGTVIGAQDAAANYSLTLQTLTGTSPCATCICLLHRAPKYNCPRWSCPCATCAGGV